MEVLSMRTLFLKTVRGRVCGQYHLSTGRVASYLRYAEKLCTGQEEEKGGVPCG